MSEAAQDEALGAARAFLAARLRPDWNTVAAVVLTRSGARHMAMNLDCTLARASICAEPVAIGMALSADPEAEIAFCAAINRHGTVIPPCGSCRELLLDYAAHARIALPDGDGYRTACLEELMPAAYKADRRRM